MSERSKKVHNRLEVQKLLEKHTRQAVGSFHQKELNETCFLNDLLKKFELIPILETDAKKSD